MAVVSASGGLSIGFIWYWHPQISGKGCLGLEPEVGNDERERLRFGERQCIKRLRPPRFGGAQAGRFGAAIALRGNSVQGGRSLIPDLVRVPTLPCYAAQNSLFGGIGTIFCTSRPSFCFLCSLPCYASNIEAQYRESSLLRGRMSVEPIFGR